jgi:hypothetical protein
MPSEAPPCRWHSLLVRLRLIAQPPIIRKALLAAGVVGTVLVSLNQGDVLLSGHVTPRVLVKSLLTPIIPFGVTLLGAFLNSHPAVQAEDLRPGWPVVRRSLCIALGVGSGIILLNHGDVLLAGTITPQIVVKILVTPWVPFCVSWYGAYAAYRHALAAQQQPLEHRRCERAREADFSVRHPKRLSKRASG